MPGKPRRMLIAQLSDPHVRPVGGLYQEVVDSNAMFAAALAHLNRLDPRRDLVLLSGDLVDKGEAGEYGNLRELLAGLSMPVLVIPGNHDDREAFRRAFRDQAYLPASGPINYVAGGHGAGPIAAPDATLPAPHHGDIAEASMHWPRVGVAAAPRRPRL